MPADIFSALSDPTRRIIVEILADHDGSPASDIHMQFHISPQAVSQHLKILRDADLVHVEKKAQQRIYRINTDAMIELEEWSYNMRLRWSSRLDAKEAVMETEIES